MSMRDQILTGIHTAIHDDTSAAARLANLSAFEIDHLATHILAALAQTPEGTPAPVASVLPASTPTLMISPADLIAAVAQDALNEVTSSETYTHTDHNIVEATWAAGPDYREVRNLLFRIQPMFGVRIRSIRPNDAPLFLVAGRDEQIDAMQRAVMTIRTLAQPVVATLDSAEQSEFWATLGNLCANADAAEHLIESNSDTYAEATAYLNNAYGHTRTLTRSTPAESGTLYEQAAAVMSQSTLSDPS